MLGSLPFDPYDDVSYDFDDLSREEVKEILNNTPIGTFLVRNSIKDFNQKVLCVNEAENLINSYKIVCNNEQSYFIRGKEDTQFNSIAQILQFYSSHYLNQSPLIKPVFYHKKVIALHDFQEDPDEPENDLFFKEGDILTMVSKTDYTDWTKAMNTKGQLGLIPSSYVKRLPFNDSRLKDLSNDVKNSNQRIEHNKDSNRESEISDEQIYDNNLEENEYGLVLKCPFEAEVIQDYTPSPYDNSHMPLKKGQIVKVTKAEQVGMWFGELNNQKGFFPFNRVQIVNTRD